MPKQEFEPKSGVGYDVVEERLDGALCSMCANRLSCTEGCGLQEEIRRMLFPEEVKEEEGDKSVSPTVNLEDGEVVG